MIVMKLELTVAGECLEEVRRMLSTQIGPTETRPGCSGCRLARDLKKGNTLIYTELWESEPDMERRIRSPQFRKILAAMECSSEQPELRFCRVTDARGLEIVERILGSDPRVPRPLFGS